MDSTAGLASHRRLVVISPHLDDAVFSCGETIAAHPGCVVITVFGGAPAEAERCSTDWDRHCGFGNAAEAMATRRREDEDALALLGARPRVLDFCDSQYGNTPTSPKVASALRVALRETRPDLVLYPLGLFHSDHALVHRACGEALAGTELPALAYEDALYRALPGLLQRCLTRLAEAGQQATPVPPPRLASNGGNVADSAPELADRKRRAIQTYVSQLRAFGSDGHADTTQPERCWRVETATTVGGHG